jgi:small conductance mechanosensitive channel
MIERKGFVSTVLPVLLAALLVAGLSGPVAAQKASAPGADSNVVKEMPAEKVGEDASELLARINADVENGQQYLEAMKTASEEDRLVLQLQLFTFQQRILNDIHQLADVLLELEKTGEQPELRRQVETLLTLVPQRLWVHIARLDDEIDAARARRTEASAQERPVIENEVAKLTARLDKVFELSLAQMEKMDRVGLDTQKVRTKLIDLLADRAEALSGRIALALDRIAELELLRKQVPDDADIPKRLTAAVKSLGINTSSMSVTLDLMEKLDMDIKAYRTQLVEATRDISAGLTDTGVAFKLAGRATDRVITWLTESGPKVFLKLLLFVGILYLFFIARRLVKAALQRALEDSHLNLSQLARRMIVQTTANLVLIFGLMIALSQLGISLGPLLAGLGIAGFIVGFALQDTLSNFASGIMILLYRPYDVDDLIDVGGVYGKVNKMSLVSTTIATFDNQMIVVPNNKIWGDVIKNVTAQDKRRVDMVFGISYSDDINKAEQVLMDILTSHEKVLEDPEPMVRLHTLGESSVDFVVRPWVKVHDYWDVYWDVTKTVKMRFDQEGISIPFPQRDVHVHNDAAIAAGPA